MELTFSEFSSPLPNCTQLDGDVDVVVVTTGEECSVTATFAVDVLLVSPFKSDVVDGADEMLSVAAPIPCFALSSSSVPFIVTNGNFIDQFEYRLA